MMPTKILQIIATAPKRFWTYTRMQPSFSSAHSITFSGGIILEQTSSRLLLGLYVVFEVEQFQRFSHPHLLEVIDACKYSDLRL